MSTVAKLKRVLSKQFAITKRKSIPTIPWEVEATPPKTPRIPNEIWCMIVGLLAEENLENVALTCQHWRTLFQPLLFTVFRVHQYMRITSDEGIIYVQSPEYLERLRLRFEFILNEHIQWAVRTIRLSVHFSPPAECTIGARHLTNILPVDINTLSGLRAMSINRGDITLLDLKRLSLFPSLEFLKIRSCNFKLETVSSGDWFEPLRLKELDCALYANASNHSLFWFARHSVY
ncbi:hypothetical protein ABKN59_004654 [Abortiporus biennis]